LVPEDDLFTYAMTTRAQARVVNATNISSICVDLLNGLETMATKRGMI